MPDTDADADDRRGGAPLRGQGARAGHGGLEALAPALLTSRDGPRRARNLLPKTEQLPSATGQAGPAAVSARAGCRAPDGGGGWGPRWRRAARRRRPTAAR